MTIIFLPISICIWGAYLIRKRPNHVPSLELGKGMFWVGLSVTLTAIILFTLKRVS